MRLTHAKTADRALLDLTLYLVTDSRMCAQRGLRQTVQEAVRGGVSVVQLREPDATDDEVVALGRQLRSALEGTGVPLIINDRVHLVETIGAAGAHIGQDDLSVPEARAMLGDDPYLGLSVHTLDQLKAAREHASGHAALDYLGVGPAWATSTKPNHATPLGPDGVRQICAASPLPCVAIGGVSAARIDELRTTKAAGVAVISAICGQPDPAGAAAALRAAWSGA